MDLCSPGISPHSYSVLESETGSSGGRDQRRKEGRSLAIRIAEGYPRAPRTVHSGIRPADANDESETIGAERALQDPDRTDVSRFGVEVDL